MKLSPKLDFASDGISRSLSFILRLVSPPKCVICGDLLESESELCPNCIKTYAKAENRRCPICGRTPRMCECRPFSMFETSDIGNRRMIALTFLGTPDSTDERDAAARRFVYSMKHSENRSSIIFAARNLSIEILRMLAASKLDVSDWLITYPPRSRSQIRKYGFDQSRQLAEKISKYTGIKLSRCFIRTSSKMQKTLNAFERKINADKTYIPEKDTDFRGRNYIIADDVITTGATVSACAAILKSGGAKTVFPVCVARTKRKKRSARRSPNRKPWFLHI